MKWKTMLLLAYLAVCAAPADATLDSTFGIYLMKEPIPPRLAAYGIGEWKDLALLDEPLISNEDIKHFDPEMHRLVVQPEVLQRLPRPPVSGLGFVVVTNGEPVFPGVLTTSISSFSFALPAINLQPSQGPELVIEHGYPKPATAEGEDPRSDAPFPGAWKKLGELEPPKKPQSRQGGSASTAPYRALGFSTNDIIRFTQPGTGVALVRFHNLEGPVLRYDWQFTPWHGNNPSKGQGAIRKSTDPRSVPVFFVHAGPIRFEWSEGNYVYFDPRVQKAERLEAIEFNHLWAPAQE